MEYTSPYSFYLDACCVGTMRIVGDRPLIYEGCFNKYRSTAFGAWIKRWRHCDGRAAISSQFAHASTDMPFVRCYEEVHYEQWLVLIASALCTARGESFRTRLLQVVGIYRPYNHLYLILKWPQWDKEADPEYLSGFSDRNRYMSGWNNIHLSPFATLSAFRVLRPDFDELVGGVRILLRVDRPDPGRFCILFRGHFMG